jgi:outer membrane biosynthesis protein TonB
MMDINEYMTKSLELQERTATALEALVKAGFQQVNVAHHSCGKTTGGAQVKHPETEVKDTPTEKTNTLAQDKPAETKVEKKEETKVEKKEETKVEKKEETKVEKKEEPAADKPAETKAKKVTADDARKALKAYAAIEGNDAAMELLTSLGAGSVSALAEQGDDKLAELVAKCGG